MQFVDMDSWPRREIFDFFTAVGRPFYSVTYRQDVTRAYRYAKEKGISFYYCMVWLVTHAVNNVEAFAYSIEGGRVARIDRRSPSFTDIKPGAEFFHICTMPCRGGAEEFAIAARERSHGQRGFIRHGEETSDLIYISCLPWLDLTGLTNEGELAADDCIPRISWGKFVREGERLVLGMSLEVNHRFVDGADIGAFAAELDRLMDEL